MTKEVLIYSPTILVVVIYLDPLTSLLEWSNQLRTSSTACGFFFCSCLLMLELISNRAHASGIPYNTVSTYYHTWRLKCYHTGAIQKIKNAFIWYAKYYFPFSPHRWPFRPPTLVWRNLWVATVDYCVVMWLTCVTKFTTRTIWGTELYPFFLLVKVQHIVIDYRGSQFLMRWNKANLSDMSQTFCIQKKDKPPCLKLGVVANSQTFQSHVHTATPFCF